MNAVVVKGLCGKDLKQFRKVDEHINLSLITLSRNLKRKLEKENNYWQNNKKFA